MPNKLTAQDYHNLARSLQIEWLGEIPVRSDKNTPWRFTCGHVYETSYSRVRWYQLSLCRKCIYATMEKPQLLTVEDFEAVAKKHGIAWLGTIPVPAGTKTLWRCVCGATWKTSIEYLQRSKATGRCTTCSREGQIDKTRRKLSLDDYLIVGVTRDIQWIGTELPQKLRDKTQWRCICGHEWAANYYAIEHHGCRKCADRLNGERIKHDAADYYELARLNDLELIGESVPTSNNEQTSWVCRSGHVYVTSYRNIISKSKPGCPMCRDFVNGRVVSRPQQKLYDLIGGELNYRHNSFSIDIVVFLGDLKIAVEYDAWYWHQKRLEFERLRDDQLIKDGWRIIHVRSGTLLPSKEQLDMAFDLVQGGELIVEIMLEDWGD